MSISIDSLVEEVQALRQQVRALESEKIGFLARYEHATTAGHVGVWDWNLKTDELFLDPALKLLLGYTDDELPNQHGAWRELVHEDDRDRRDAALQASVHGQNDSYDLEYRVVAKDGGIRWIHTRGRVLRDENSKPARFTGTDTDVTDRKQADEDREGLQRQLHQARKLESIGTLAGGIAHDFNNILAVILGNAQLALAKEAAGEVVRDNIDEMLKAAVRGRDIVRQILAFSRSGEAQRRPLSIAAAVDEALRFVRPFVPTSIRIRTEFPAEDMLVETEPSQIHQVLLNLCSNARDAMPDGGEIVVLLRARRFDEPFLAAHRRLDPGEWVVLEVQDDGHGIPPENRERVFDPFYTTKQSGKGTGLGLAMVYGIVSEHGGDVLVDDAPGGGVTIRIYLPVCEDADRRGTKAADKVMRGQGRVLLVDDEESLVHVCRNMLEGLGYDVVSYTSAADALRVFMDSPDAFDAVVTDQSMPELTGLRFAREVNAVRPGTPTVLCTGYSDSVSAESLHEAGVSQLVMKPFLASELSLALSHALVGQRQADAESNGGSK